MRLLTTLTLASFILVSLINSFAQGQYFHPNIEDKKYLDRIETDVSGDIQRVRKDLINQAHVVEDVTTVFIGAKLKQNLFKVIN